MADDLPKPKRLRRWEIAAIVAVFTLGAVFVASRQSFSSRAAKLRVGMTRQEVFAVMGHPDHLMKLGNMDIALFTPLPFNLHALIMFPGQTLRGNSGVPATEFPAYVEFKGDIADRIFVEGREINARK